MDGRGRAATINDVAARAGVSRQTVTRAMNDMSGINAATKERVLAAAKALRYRPSRFGRGLVKRGTPVVGLTIDDLTNPYYPELASAVIRAAAARHWQVLLTELVHVTDVAETMARLSTQVDALIGYLPGELGANGLPVVRIDDAPGEDCVVVLSDEGAVAATARHLVDRGVVRPVLLDSGDGAPISGRLDRVGHALAGLGVPAGSAFIGEQSVTAAEVATRSLLTGRPDTDALICFNDVVAMGALAALRDLGRRVPEDVAVVGYDGLPIGRLVTPQLTTIAVDMAELAEAAVELCAGLLDGTVAPGEHRRVAYRLEVRRST